jgi:hypothetical protein
MDFLTLNDGRKDLYQWDSCRTATVSVDCDTVHFSNLKYGKALVVDVVSGEVIIPDELLQSGENIIAWAFVGTPENGYTRKEQTIPVVKRPRPSDYVFMPTEQITLDAVLKAIGSLDELLTEDKSNLVNAINEVFKSGGTGGSGVGIEDIKQTVTSTESGGVNVVSVMLTNGEVHTFEVRNGQKGDKGDRGDRGETGQAGADGYTPIKGVDYFDGKDGKDGKDGQDGKDGYTPQKYVDYFTEADKQELVASVLSALPVYEGEVETV